MTEGEIFREHCIERLKTLTHRDAPQTHESRDRCQLHDFIICEAANIHFQIQQFTSITRRWLLIDRIDLRRMGISRYTAILSFSETVSTLHCQVIAPKIKNLQCS
ncbi:hypothetical protein BWP39_27395 [Paraburkholderia acidicola]|uniref:Uncharacterized protein n=1 Tax=Paraburkholderia acidicola TaxID=1912599 RepID=A0A2A4ETB6_9BURK|nr:hypothetical protein BWP39_27395 [Paraburkholderia acidicola]